MTRAGRALPVLTAAALIALTSVPYLYGYRLAPPDKWFSGVVYNVHDTAQYLSWMRESGERFLIDNRLTSEPNPAVFVNLHWWIPGRVAAWLDWSLPTMYQALRVSAIAVCVWVFWWASGLFAPGRLRRLTTFFLALFTSGWGWLWVVEKQFSGSLRYPHDVYTTPGNTFWVMLASPHLTFALALTLLALGLTWKAETTGRWTAAAAAGSVALFLGAGHIYDLVTVWAVAGAFGLALTLREGLRWDRAARLGLIVVLSAPAPLYFAWVSSSANPTWQQALAQYDFLGAFTPSPPHLVILLGLTFVLAAFQTLHLPGPGSFGDRLARLDDRTLFLRVWFLTNTLIIYLPLKFQVMLLTGLQFVASLLAVDLLYDTVLPSLARRLPADGLASAARVTRLAPVLLVLAVVPTNAYLFAWRLVDLGREEAPFFLEGGQRASLAWLDAHAESDAVVLSAFTTGHFVPGLTGLRPVLSNAVMTLDFTSKRDAVEAFFGAASEAERRMLLARYAVDYVIHGPAERALGAFDPDTSPDLRRIFSSGDTRVYRVDASGARDTRTAHSRSPSR